MEDGRWKMTRILIAISFISVICLGFRCSGGDDAAMQKADGYYVQDYAVCDGQVCQGKE
jgi:hypothetical protein